MTNLLVSDSVQILRRQCCLDSFTGNDEDGDEDGDDEDCDEDDGGDDDGDDSDDGDHGDEDGKKGNDDEDGMIVSPAKEVVKKSNQLTGRLVA